MTTAPNSLQTDCARRVTPTLALLLIFVLALIGSGCASSRKSAGPQSPPAPYTRIAHPDDDTIALQIAVRKFAPARGPGPSIWLSAVSHIGESNYFATLQRHLDAKSLVLFEGVGARDKKMKFDPEEESSIQQTLATSLHLVFQLTAIDYDRPHFRNCDLTIPELQRMLAGNTSTPSTNKSAPANSDGDSSAGGSKEFQSLMGIMDGSSALGILVHLGIKFVGASPKLQAMMKLAMIQTLGQLQGDMAEARGLPPELQRLMAVIIQGRNEVVIRDLKPHLGASHAKETISVFYGAGHMADLEKRLVRELGYRRQDDTWLTALSVNTKKSGLSKSELDMVEGIVKWQMEALKGQ